MQSAVSRGSLCGVVMMMTACANANVGGGGRGGPPPVELPMTDASSSPRPDATAHPEDGGGGECGAVTFELTETPEALVVPEGIPYLHVVLWGAGGNGEGACPDLGVHDGGLGGFTEAVFPVPAERQLTVIVGQRGRAGVTGESPDRFGFGAWGGGGLSGVFLGGGPIAETDQERALAIAGGGGSSARGRCAPGGTGNHADAGGAEATMRGSFGEDEVSGGGGGLEGGAGGGVDSPAHGGKGHVALPLALRSRMLAAEPGDMVPPEHEHPDYDGTAGQTERPGLVIVRFVCEVPLI